MPLPKPCTSQGNIQNSWNSAQSYFLCQRIIPYQQWLSKYVIFWNLNKCIAFIPPYHSTNIYIKVIQKKVFTSWVGGLVLQCIMKSMPLIPICWMSQTTVWTCNIMTNMSKDIMPFWHTTNFAIQITIFFSFCSTSTWNQWLLIIETCHRTSPQK
jgi:hypothetical protein